MSGALDYREKPARRRRYFQKQMRLGPATRAALLSRTLLTAVFRQGRKLTAHSTPKSAMRRCPPEARASDLKFSASILLGRRMLGEGLNVRAPIHWT